MDNSQNYFENESILDKEINLRDTIIGLSFQKIKLNHKDIGNIKLEKSHRKFEKARILIKQQKYHEAIKLLRELISEEDENANYHSYLGFALMKKGWNTYAQIEFKKALTHDPQNFISKKFLDLKDNENEKSQVSLFYRLKNLLKEI